MKCKFSQVVPGQIFWGEPPDASAQKRFVKILMVTNFYGQVNAVAYDYIDVGCFQSDDEVEVYEILTTNQQRWF